MLVRLAHKDRDRVGPLLRADPVMTAFAGARLLRNGSETPYEGEVWAYERDGRIRSAIMNGANLVPIATTRETVEPLAEAVLREGRRCASILGPQSEVLALWARLEDHWDGVREVRANQPFLVASDRPTVAPDRLVRRVRPSELDLLLPACVDMFTEEVGVSPVAGGAGPGYRKRLQDLVQTGRSLARFEDGRIVFKAEIAAVAGDVCQIQGVWVAPDRRGEGLGGAGMAAVVEYAKVMAPIVSLYVNDYNAPALMAYRRAGFRPVGAYATVLF